MKKPFCPLLISLAGCVALAQTPQYNHCETNEQLRHYQTVSGPQLSPDGQRVVYVQHESTADGAAGHLWLASIAGGPPRQLTFSAPSDHTGEGSPEWMPDGSAILFTARRGETRQIFRLPVNGGEAAPIEIKVLQAPGAKGQPEDLSIGSFEVSPDGRWIAIHASAPETAQAKADTRDKKDAHFAGDEPNPAQLWLYSFATGKAAAVPFPERVPRGSSWSEDSQQLAVVTAPPGDADDLGPANQLELVSVADPTHATVVRGAPAAVSGAVFSPDGQQLALSAQTGHDAPPGVSGLYILPTAGGTARELSAESLWNVGGRGAMWSTDGKTVLADAQRGTESGLAQFSEAGGAPQWNAAMAPDASSFATNHNRTGDVFIAQATNRMPQVYYSVNPAAPAGPPLSRANANWASEGRSQATEVSWTSSDGMTIHGLYYPPNGEGCAGAAGVVDGKSPMILMVHGGPTGSFGQSFSPLVQWFTAQGWAVLEPNPRGSTGYGWKFAAANHNDLGGKDYDDVMAGVDWALAHHAIDPKRLGVYGYSYGGEMAGFIEGKTDRFAAIISGAPVIDQYSEYGTESGSWYDRWFYGKPWMNAADAWRQSPLSYAGNAKTPLLLLQGQADTTDPLGQSEEMYRALRQMGVPVKLMEFPRENHGPLSGGIGGSPSTEPWHGFEARAEILDWFNDHFSLGGTYQ